MWLLLAFCSAFCLGFYDVFKKISLKENAILPVLALNTLFSACIFLPFLYSSVITDSIEKDSLFYVASLSIENHAYVLLKSVIVLSSWIFGYMGMKHLPITIVGPINATRPIFTLLGALFIFGERLNLYQWIGISLGMLSIYLLSKVGKREGVNFKHDKWVICLFVAAVLGAISGLYDKFLMQFIPPMAVQAWYTQYQCLLMGSVILFIWYPQRKKTTPFHWSYAIPFISLFVSIADFAYFYALSMEDALIAVVSMIRRGSVLVSFAIGAFFLKEQNVRQKFWDLLLILIGMLFLYFGSK
ncbi:MAG: DMT family transporter [Phocaeicola sp.]|nr:DMT family transporter [Phocaeicola sp.]